LEDGTEFTIPLREDGYIYATGLCKAAGKKMYDWLRLNKTKSVKTKLEKKIKTLTKNKQENLVEDTSFRGRRCLRTIKCKYSTDCNILDTIHHIQHIYEPRKQTIL
jgi:hypothetical protein